MRPARKALLLASLLAAPLAGCGIEDPYARAPKRSGEHAADVVGAPEATLRLAATLAGNWTSAGAPATFRRLAALSVGDARATFEQIAAGARTDPQQAGARSAATVEAVVVRGNGPVRHAIVVTYEQITSARTAGLPAEYRVTLATVVRRGGVWAIASWAPQP